MKKRIDVFLASLFHVMIAMILRLKVSELNI